jgi:hypothetical protein
VPSASPRSSLGASAGPSSEAAPRRPSAAAPEPIAPPSPAPLPPPRRWYGWQLLLVDAAPIVALSARPLDRGRDRAGVFLPGSIVYLLAGPIVHNVQDRAFRSLPSLALRGVALYLLSSSLDRAGCGGSAGGDLCSPSAALPLLLLGASAIDAGLLGWKRDAPAQQSALWVSPIGAGLAAGGVW